MCLIWPIHIFLILDLGKPRASYLYILAQSLMVESTMKRCMGY